MTPVLNMYGTLLIDLRFHIVVSGGHQGQGTERVDPGQRLGCPLDPRHLPADPVPYLAEQIILQGEQLVLRAQDNVLQLLQLIRGVALRVGQCLFSYKILRNHILKGVGHLKIVPEHLVEFHLQIFDSRLVRLCIVPLPDDAPFLHG